MTRGEVYFDWLTKESTSVVRQCEDNGHCYHQGTAWDTSYCCRCGQQMPKTTAERLNFYRSYN